MSGPCPYVCLNKTDGPNSILYRVPCPHCGGLGYLTVDTTSESTVQCPICMGVGAVVHFEDNDSKEDMLKEDNPCKGCKHIALRYPYASMYPCNNCIRADMKDYYEPQEESNG